MSVSPETRYRRSHVHARRREFFMRPLLVASIALLLTTPTLAADVCKAKGVMGGKAYSMTHCVVSYYDDQKSVTIWLSETPFTADEAEQFVVSSYARDKEADGRPRTQMHLGFCPGGGTAAPSPSAPKSVEFWMTHKDSPWLSRQWVVEPKDKDWKFEKLSGKLEPGGKLSGRMTGSRVSEGKYAWEIDFDLTLPAKSALGGMGCGS
jgi:hypothetical protein